MTTPALIRIGSADTMAEGELRRIEVSGHPPMVLCRNAGRFHLLDDLCSHGLASLSEGEIEDGQLFCPFHGGAFDLETGAPTQRPCTLPIKVYALRQVEGEIFIDSDGDGE